MSASPGDMVQVHLLTAYPAVLLNRDEVGLAKRLPFGGEVRTRVSSQCLKKHWREAETIVDLGDLADRSDRIYRRRLAYRLLELPLHAADAQFDDHPDHALAAGVAKHLMKLTLATKGGSGDPEHGDRPLQTKQLTVLTRAEVEFLQDLAREIFDELKSKGVTEPKDNDFKDVGPLDAKELRKLLPELPASLDTALFGRMVTSDVFDRVDAAVAVAHAFTTHAEESEADYFTAVDTLKDEDDDAGAGLIQETELTSGVFYLYVVIDMNQLRDNLIGFPPAFAERLAAALIKTMTTVSPGAKRGSTAPFSRAEFLLLERGAAQPRTLANAFLKPVEADGDGVMEASIGKLFEYRTRLDQMYGAPEAKVALATIHEVPADGLPEPVALDQAIAAIFEEPDGA